MVAIADRVSWGSCGSDVGVGSQIIRVDEKRMEKTEVIKGKVMQTFKQLYVIGILMFM